VKIRHSLAEKQQIVFSLATIISLLALLPILAARHLPLLDAPAHEARIALLRTLWVQGGDSAFYRATDPISANMAFDTIGVLLLNFVSPEVAGRVFLGLTMVATLWGIATLNRVVTGRWSLVPLAVGLLIYHAVTIGCFFSYLFALALVPWALAARLSVRGPLVGFIAGCLCTLVLTLCHLFAAGIYIAFLAADRAARVARGRLRPAACMACLAEFLPAALMVPTVFRGGGGGNIEYMHHPGFLQVKAAGLAEALTSGSLWGDAALIVGLLACLAIAISRSKLTLSQPAAAGIIALLLLYFILPFELGSASNVDKRMPIAVAFLAVGFTDVRLRMDIWTRRLIGAVAVAFVVKQTALMLLWLHLDPAIDTLVAALRSLPPGAVIMQAECHPVVRSIAGSFAKWHPPLSHTAGLATLDDKRFAASNWAIPGQQPIAVRPAYLPYYELQEEFDGSLCSAVTYRYELARIRNLSLARSGPPGPVYLLLIRPPEPDMLAGDAEFVTHGPDFELYAASESGRPSPDGSMGHLNSNANGQ
jgi:hypothetical protein